MERELFTLLSSIISSLWTATGKARPSMGLIMLDLGAETVIVLVVMDGIEVRRHDFYSLERLRKFMVLEDEEK